MLPKVRQVMEGVEEIDGEIGAEVGAEGELGTRASVGGGDGWETVAFWI